MAGWRLQRVFLVEANGKYMTLKGVLIVHVFVILMVE